jgi:hypothetical protein
LAILASLFLFGSIIDKTLTFGLGETWDEGIADPSSTEQVLVHCYDDALFLFINLGVFNFQKDRPLFHYTNNRF